MTDTLSYVLKTSVNQILGSTRSTLKKGEEHARALGVEDSVMLAARLYPDMLALSRQVQIACDTVARGAARLAGMEMPSLPDTEQTFAELIARCQTALDYVNAIDDAQIDATAKTTLQIPMGQASLPMTGEQYLSGFILTNLHFHAAMAYGLLRMQGVPIGKRDFLVPG